MAKREQKTPDKYRVGQSVALVLDKETGFAGRNGWVAVVTAPRVFGAWECEAPDIPRAPAVCKDWRYTIRTGRRELMNVTEGMLRPIYDGEALSTWEKFEKSTGLNLRGELVTVMPRRRPSKEANHGQAPCSCVPAAWGR